MLTIKEIRLRLADENLSEVARAVKVTRSYIWALAHGMRLNPSSQLQERLSDYLEGKRE